MVTSVGCELYSHVFKAKKGRKVRECSQRKMPVSKGGLCKGPGAGMSPVVCRSAGMERGAPGRRHGVRAGEASQRAAGSEQHSETSFG